VQKGAQADTSLSRSPPRQEEKGGWPIQAGKAAPRSDAYGQDRCAVKPIAADRRRLQTTPIRTRRRSIGARRGSQKEEGDGAAAAIQGQGWGMRGQGRQWPKNQVDFRGWVCDLLAKGADAVNSSSTGVKNLSVPADRRRRANLTRARSALCDWWKSRSRAPRPLVPGLAARPQRLHRSRGERRRARRRTPWRCGKKGITALCDGWKA